MIKFQQGGALPLVSYTPVILSQQQQQLESARTSSSKKEGEDLTDKDILELLSKLKGLPNESRAIVNQLQNFIINGGSDSASIASRYLSVIGHLQTANFNLDKYNKAQELVNSRGGLDEVAITSRGQLVGRNQEGDFKLLTPEEAKNSEYIPITNQELLTYRAHDPSLSFDTDILNVVESGVGISYINDLVQKAIAKLESSTKIEEGYFSSNYLIQGLEQLKQVMHQGNQDLDYIYKYKITNKDQQQQIKSALSYIMQTLPQNIIGLLKYKSDGTLKGATNLIAQLATSQHNVESFIELDLQKNKDGEIEKNSAKGINSLELGPVGQLLSDYGQKSNITIQTAEGMSHGINLTTIKHPITDKEGNSVGISTLDEVAKSAFAGALDFENVSMGGGLIDTASLAKVKINGTDLHTGYLPIDVQRYSETGDIVPDLDMLEKFNQVNKNLNGVTDPEIINKAYQEAGLPIMYDESGNVLTNYAKFGMINGVALSTAFKENVALSSYITEVMDENEGNSVMRVINKSLGNDYEEEWDPNNSWMEWGSINPLYKGVIFIPLITDYFTATSATGKGISVKNAELIEAIQQAKQKFELKDKYVKTGQI